MDVGILLNRLRDMVATGIALLPNLALAGLAFAAFYFAAKIIRRSVIRVTRRFHPNAGNVIGRLAQLGALVLGALISLSIVLPDFKPANVISLLGIGSVAVGFAFRDILQNFLAGIILLLMEPFRVGDQVIVGTFEGTVEEIQTRATLIKTYDGRRIVMPNSAIFTQAVTVITAFDKRRGEYDVGVGYGDDLAKVKELLLAAVESVPSVLADPSPDVLVTDLAASTVNVRVRFWIAIPAHPTMLETRSDILTAIKTRLTEGGIDMPFPTQQILLHDQTDENDGDRTKQREGWPNTVDSPKPANLAAAVRELGAALRGRASPPSS